MMWKRLCRRRSPGFTLTELLAALLILVMLTVILSSGLPVAVKVYRESVFVSESEILASTLNTALGDILRYATDIQGADGPRFDTATDASIIDGSIAADDGVLVIVKADGSVDRPLLNKAAYTSLRAEDFSLSFSGGSFSGSYRLVSTQDPALAKEVVFAFAPLNPSPAPATP